jgi:hypothetical protein
MSDEKAFKLKLEEAGKLISKHQIRYGLKEKIYCTYPQIFDELFELLSLPESDEFFFQVHMHFAERIYQEYPGDKDNIEINSWLEPNFGYILLLQEIFDDYWAAFLCFQHGFTKQCTEILRNTLELILNMFHMRFCGGEKNEITINWAIGNGGLGDVKSIIDQIKKLEFLKTEDVSPYLKRLWDILCESTHSHKKVMTSMAMSAGPLSIRDKMMFEYFIILQTRSMFLFVVETELKMVRQFFINDQETHFTQKILNSIDKMLNNLNKYSKIIDNIKIGYIIHRQEIKLDSGKTVVFSLKLNNEYELTGKYSKSLTREDGKELEGKIERILFASL